MGGPAHPEPRRARDREHVKFVAGHPCLICGRHPADPHHLRFAQSRALGRKVSDEFTVPLCRGHHREGHRCGDGAAWWAKVGVERPWWQPLCGASYIHSRDFDPGVRPSTPSSRSRNCADGSVQRSIPHLFKLGAMQAALRKPSNGRRRRPRARGRVSHVAKPTLETDRFEEPAQAAGCALMEIQSSPSRPGSPARAKRCSSRSNSTVKTLARRMIERSAAVASGKSARWIPMRSRTTCLSRATSASGRCQTRSDRSVKPIERPTEKTRLTI